VDCGLRIEDWGLGIEDCGLWIEERRGAAWALEADHRTLGCETIQVRAVLPSGCGVPPQTVSGASRAGLSSQLSQDSSGTLPATVSATRHAPAECTAALNRSARLRWPVRAFRRFRRAVAVDLGVAVMQRLDLSR
jgi:hypothetical protein